MDAPEQRYILIVKAQSEYEALMHAATHLNEGYLGDGHITLDEASPMGTDAFAVTLWSYDDGTQRRLGEWFAEDLGKDAPYPLGALLYWTDKKEERCRLEDCCDSPASV